ncbi:MAG: alpha/beta hydrolase-fold protein [Chloroflexota bacterium]
MSDLLVRAHAEGTPLIDGDSAVFVWEGETAPYLYSDATGWGKDDGISLTETAPGLWTHSLEFLPDTYMEYAYINAEGRWRDPFNKRLISNGMGKKNHWFGMPAMRHTDLTLRKRGVARGLVTEHKITAGILVADVQRSVYLYHPPTNEPVPLLVVLDGKDYATRAKLPIIVDNLIAQKRIRPIALAMPQNGGEARFIEYMCSDATLAFLGRDVLPLATEHLHILPIEENPGAYGILGASMGGLMALYCGLRLPEVFGKVISQSGAFGFDLMGNESVIYDLVRLYERRPIKIWMDVGRYEWLLTVNRKMHGVLNAQGYAPIYREYSGGHNYTAWRNDVVLALEALFAP